ncbi:hypothetical protein [Alkaliphilus peptidifermentans]|uniref:Mg2+ and Co2+ transporter CorB n=1 Tax=Alkaliphilus peptidifermentans DSM 18978 TaxID=1120976 RepID=A0A1G5KFE5_9FIRM|nr:hypothetical protein [Alkaliphilus peptidifermentans]SCY98770.1 hypothetical protein SAMN03080606_03416 [Alkaliphilus peptidifermentans DSM 18978]
MSADSKNIRMIKKGNKGTNEMNGIWKKYNLKWVLLISIWTFLLTMIFSVLSEVILTNTPIIFAFIILLLIVLIGVLSDMIGIAVAAADVKPFHAMAADKVNGSKAAIKLIKNASAVSSFCNDVIGDICGIVSGVAGASIVLQLPNDDTVTRAIFTIILTGFVASLTVGGKGIGKTIALEQYQKIVFRVARILFFINDRFGIDLIPDVNGKK